MKKLGVAIIGAGAIAGVHIQAYLKHSDKCNIVAVCDLFVDKCEKLISEYNLDSAKAYKDYNDALVSQDVDVVSICLPPSMHATVSISALNAKKHVLCEKPLASSLEECDLMIKAAKDNGVTLASVAQNRFKTPHMKIKEMIEDGDIGKVLFATVNSLWWRGENYYDIWWRGTWEKESGGCVINHAVHHIDLLQWIMGMPKSVSAFITNLNHHNSECEDLGIAILQYPEAVAEVTSSLVHHNELQSISFQGTKGCLSVPFDAYSSKPLANGFPEENLVEIENIKNKYASLSELEEEGHPALINNFLSSILGKEDLLVDGQQGRNTIELITAIYKSAYEKATVKLPIEEDDIFYKKGGIASVMPHFYEKTKSVDNFSETKPITLGRDVGK